MAKCPVVWGNASEHSCMRDAAHEGDCACSACGKHENFNDVEEDEPRPSMDDYDGLDENGEPLIDGVGFADPTGESSLRAETPSNPRNLRCPTCHAPNRLTPLDRAAGYQCNSCSDKTEQGRDIYHSSECNDPECEESFAYVGKDSDE